MRKLLFLVVFLLGLGLGVVLGAMLARHAVSPGGEQVAVETVEPASAPAGLVEE